MQTMVVAGADADTRQRCEAVKMGPMLQKTSLKKPSFNSNAIDKYAELKNFRLGVNNILKLTVQATQMRYQ